MAHIIAFPTQAARPVMGNTPPVAPKITPKKEEAAALHRNSMLARVHINLGVMCRDLERYTEDIYRNSLLVTFGYESAAELSNEELHQLLLYQAQVYYRETKRYLPRSGRNHKKEAPKALTGTDERKGWLEKIEGLLTAKAKYEKSEVPWGYALGILKRQTKGVLKSLDQAGAEELRKVMLALKRDAVRHGYWVE